MASLKTIHIYLAASALIALVAGSPMPRATCGYSSCPVPKEGMMNVHLIPHTHDDVGWLKTVDQYFYGRRSDLQIVAVQAILDSVVNELQKDPARKFIYVETAYLRQWWDTQSEGVREIVKSLLESGQLEIIGGGWSMHDEAVTHYHSIIDQFSWGFKNLEDMFETSCVRPHIGWQIDPFGHARESGSLMTMLGFDGLFFARLDQADKRKRFADRELELIWKTSANQEGSSYLFTSVMHDYYYPPAGYCFDFIFCKDAPIIDDARSPDYNVDKRVDGFIRYINRQGKYLTSNNILIPMGTDFSYQQAITWYENLDKLIKYVNARQETSEEKINLMYSTPSCYLKAVHTAGLNYTVKEDDFFPYSSDINSYWTGYFTSRPTLKYMERLGNNFLQVSKQLSVLADLREERWEDLSSLREAMGIMQHHDAITGTEKQHVAEDYALRLHQGMVDCQNTTNMALNKLIIREDAEELQEPLEFNSCLLSNISVCDVTEVNDNFVVTVYNPQSQRSSMFVRLPVDNFTYDVYDGQSTKLETQMLLIPKPVQNIPGRESNFTQELVFRASDIPPMGFKSFHVSKTNQEAIPPPAVDTFVINNGVLEVKFSQDQHRLESVTYLSSGKVFSVSQDFQFYKSYAGINLLPMTMSSGAYIFRPADDNKFPVSAEIPTLEFYEGVIVSEVHQKYNEWASLVTRIYRNVEEVEMEWVIGPIPVDDEVGKEVVTVLKIADWETNATFYTDSNGRETLKRVRNYRPTWDFNPTFEPISSNYYPITAAISLQNFASGSEDEEFVVVTDRAQGGGSIQDGELEIMLHRRLLYDDDKGVDEALNEEAFGTGLVAKGKHILFFGQNRESPTATFKKRTLVRDKMVLAPWVFLAPTTQSQADWQNSYKHEYKGLMVDVPENINILTLEPWGGDNILVRAEHFMEASDDPEFSLASNFSLRGLVERITDEVAIVETTLGGVQHLHENTRLEFKVVGQTEMINQQIPRPEEGESKSNIVLNPMQIRTFVVQNSSSAKIAQLNILAMLFLISIHLCV